MFKKNLCLPGILFAFATPLWGPPCVLAADGSASNLRGGLDLLVAEELAKSPARSTSAGRPAAANPFAESVKDHAFRSPSGEVLVYVRLNGQEPASRVEKALPAGARVQARELSGKTGLLEVWVRPESVIRLAGTPGVSSVGLVPRPVTNVGAVDSQGVALHRVNAVPPNINGTNVRVGIISDSFAATVNVNDTAHTARARTTLAQDIASGDLPGPGNPAGRTTPVAIVSDPFAGDTPAADRGSDEGRGMAQIVHDVAPGARLAFASGFGGQATMAEAIRALASTAAGAFGADIIVDDVLYLDAPMFQDGIVAQAVDEVVGRGVSYFTSASNVSPTSGYFDDARLWRTSVTPLAGTNLDFSTVPPALYAGGLHDFIGAGGDDYVQVIRKTSSTASISFQWDEFQDDSLGNLISPSLVAQTETIPAGRAISFTQTLVAGRQYVVATRKTTDASVLDTRVIVRDAAGNDVISQDTDLDETAVFTAPAAGSYSILIASVDNTTGPCDVFIFETDKTQTVFTDYNLLFFSATGAYLGSVGGENNVAKENPIIFAGIPGAAGTTYQVVIARGNSPTAANRGRKIRYVLYGAENTRHFRYDAPTIFGHAASKGAITVGAYSAFRPYLPESYSATGPAWLAFGPTGTRINPLERRLKPEISALNGVNTTAFPGPNKGADFSSDTDAFPNFAGTSAAAPHAAAIAALVLQARGGRGAVTPAQMRTILQRSAVQHDLTPQFSSGTAKTPSGTVVVSVSAEASDFAVTDRNAFSVTYTGPSAIASLSLNVANANATGGTVNAIVAGLLFDSRTVANGGGLPFTLGALTGLTANQITATFSGTPGVPGIVGAHFPQLNLAFAPKSFTNGRGFNFGIDRDERRISNDPATAGRSDRGESADLFGPMVDLPNGDIRTGAATFSGRFEDGTTFSGTFTNPIGTGWTYKDGYGFIDAARAVAQPLP
ncbi:MAG: S8 family serine peptidase [Verrucomicrobia bacterium]|nr:S8 family serine peptidase [Verrucomicrobiota bacterium]